MNSSSLNCLNHVIGLEVTDNERKLASYRITFKGSHIQDLEFDMGEIDSVMLSTDFIVFCSKNKRYILPMCEILTIRTTTNE